MSIQKYLDKIKDAVFGKDIREAIYNSIKQCYDDAAINNDNANMEVKFARGSHPTLNDRLTENEKNQKEINEQLVLKANESDLIVERNRINNLINISSGEIDNVEVSDSRIGENGVKYDTLGEAVRNQIKLVNNSLYDIHEICKFSSNDIKGLVSTSCNIIKGRRYRIVVTTNSITANQFGTLDGKPLTWVDSSKVYTKALNNETMDFIATKSCSRVGLYNGTIGSFSLVVYELKSASDEIDDLKKQTIPHSIKEAIDENNREYKLRHEILIVPIQAVLGTKDFKYNFIKGNLYRVKIQCTSDERATFQCGTLVKASDTSYADKTEIFTKIPANYEWTFIASSNASYLRFYCSSKTVPYSVEVYHDKRIKDTLDNLQNDVDNLHNELSNLQNEPKSVLLKGNPTLIAEFNGIKNDDISCTNWTQDITCITQQSDGANYFTKGAVLQKYCTAYNKVLIYDFSAKENSIVCAYTQTAKIENLFSQGYCITVDFKNKVLAIRNKYGSGATSIVDTLPSIFKSINISVDNYVDKNFRLIIKRNNKRGVLVQLISLTDYTIIATLETDFSSEIVPPYGLGYDYPAFTVIEGTASLYNLKVLIEDSRNCYLYIIGDSLTEGVGTMPVDGWAYKVAKAIPNTIVSGRGGATINSVIRKIDDECKFLKPKYVMFMIGTNGGNTREKLATLIDKIKSMGAIPIGCYIPCNKNGSQTSVNKLLDDFDIKKIRMDIATSIDYILANGFDSSLFVADGVHLNEKGNVRMYNRVLIDCPEIF